MKGSRADVFIQSWRKNVMSNHEQSRFASRVRQRRRRLERQQRHQHQQQEQPEGNQQKQPQSSNKQTTVPVNGRRERIRWNTPRRGQSVGPSSDAGDESKNESLKVSPTYSTSSEFTMEDKSDVGYDGIAKGSTPTILVRTRGIFSKKKLSDDNNESEEVSSEGSSACSRDRASPNGVELLHEQHQNPQESGDVESINHKHLDIFRTDAKEDTNQESRKLNWRQQRRKTPQRHRAQDMQQQPQQNHINRGEGQRQRRFRRQARRRRQRRMSQELPNFPDGVLCQQDLRQTGLIRDGQMQVHEDQMRELDAMLREIDRHQKEMFTTMERQQAEAKELQERIEQQIQRHVQVTRASKRSLGQHWWTKVVSNRLELANAARRARTEQILLPSDEIDEILEGVDLEKEDLVNVDHSEEKEENDECTDATAGTVLVGFTELEEAEEEEEEEEKHCNIFNANTGGVLADFTDPRTRPPI